MKALDEALGQKEVLEIDLFCHWQMTAEEKKRSLQQKSND